MCICMCQVWDMRRRRQRGGAGGWSPPGKLTKPPWGLSSQPHTDQLELLYFVCTSGLCSMNKWHLTYIYIYIYIY